MTLQEVLNYIIFDEPDLSTHIKNIEEKYSNLPKLYDDKLRSIVYNEDYNLIPDKLYKFISLNSGVSALDGNNLQFSHPLGFRCLENPALCDTTEFSFERFYIDSNSVEFMKQKIKRDKLNYSSVDNRIAATYILYNYVINFLERNKVLCMSNNVENDYMWSKFAEGICIEYNTELFKRGNINFSNEDYKLIFGKVVYTDDLACYPMDFRSNKWISNIIFAKKRDPYIYEDEFRILYSFDFDPIKTFSVAEERRKLGGNRLLERDFGQVKKDYPTFSTKYINKIFIPKILKNNIELLKILDKYNIQREII
ncbi:hypothetical protein ACR79B_05050 [Sphingobacterium spiritivorum]|uniref:hypothetical protein n=1 Tax=Sphingobacterium spiritivorum TaxID=258 RepID=UPI003DA362BC